MKVLLKRDFQYEGEEGPRTIGSGTVVIGKTAEAALSEGAGEQIPENQPNFNPLPGQGVAAASFNVNEQPVDPVADQYVGQGKAEESTGTNDEGTRPQPDSPSATGSTGRDMAALTDAQVQRRVQAVQQQLSQTQSDEERTALQSQLEQLQQRQQTSATTSTKSLGAAPMNKATAPDENKQE